MSDPGLVCGIARLMKSHTVVAYGTRLNGSFTGFAFPSGMSERDPPGPPAASGPWQKTHFCLKMAAPSLALPFPGGNPLPSGAMAVSAALISASAGVLPNWYVCPFADVVVQTATAIAATSTLAAAGRAEAGVRGGAPIESEE